jgi:hypothetical protein
MQTSDKHKVATPADWRPGDKVIIPPPGSCGQAAERVRGAGADYECLDWFICLKSLPEEKQPYYKCETSLPLAKNSFTAEAQRPQRRPMGTRILGMSG